MKCKSVSTTVADGYRAGSALGEGLRDLCPEVIILFASVSYGDQFADLFDGLYDALESGASQVVVFGGTSDGIYETGRVAHHGACALGLDSGGRMRWRTAVETGVGRDSFAASRACAERAAEGLQPSLAFVLTDGLMADGVQVVAGVSEVLKIPFFGALASDDRKFHRTFVLVDGQVLEDAVAILVAEGDLPLVLSAASGWTPVGKAGRVDECQGNRIQRIGGKPAQVFMEEQLGKTPSEVDLGIVPLATYARSDDEHFSLRSPSHFHKDSQDVTTFGRVAQGHFVRVCTATRDNVIEAVERALDGVRETSFDPVAAVVISCAGRRWLLEDRSEEEVKRVFSAVGKRVPLVGMASYGEMGPLRLPDHTYSPVLFHNVTYVICLIGA